MPLPMALYPGVSKSSGRSIAGDFRARGESWDSLLGQGIHAYLGLTGESYRALESKCPPQDGPVLNQAG